MRRPGWERHRKSALSGGWSRIHCARREKCAVYCTEDGSRGCSIVVWNSAEESWTARATARPSTSSAIRSSGHRRTAHVLKGTERLQARGWFNAEARRQRGGEEGVSMKIKLSSVMVDDQDKVLNLYGFGLCEENRHTGRQAKWLTVVSPEGADDIELLLGPNGHSSRHIRTLFQRRHSSNCICC